MRDINDIILHMRDLLDELDENGYTPDGQVYIRAAYSSLCDAVMRMRCADLFTDEE
jgi:hypothetical protein